MKLPEDAHTVVASGDRYCIIGHEYAWRSDTACFMEAEDVYATWIGERLVWSERPLVFTAGRLFRLGIDGVEELDPTSMQVVKEWGVRAGLIAADGERLVLTPLDHDQRRVPGLQVYDLDGHLVTTHSIGEVHQVCAGFGQIVVGLNQATLAGPIEGSLQLLPAARRYGVTPEGWLLDTTVWSHDRRPIATLGKEVEGPLACLDDGRVVVAGRQELRVLRPRPLTHGPLRSDILWAVADEERLAVMASSGGDLAFRVGDHWIRVPTGTWQPRRGVWWNGGLVLGAQRVLELRGTDGRLLDAHLLPPDNRIQHLAAHGDRLLIVGEKSAWVVNPAFETVAGPWPSEDLRHGALHGEHTVLCSEAGEVWIDGERQDLTGHRACFSGDGSLLLLTSYREGVLYRWPSLERLRPHPGFSRAEPVADGILWCEGRTVGHTTADDDEEGLFHDDVMDITHDGANVLTAHRHWLGVRDQAFGLQQPLPMHVSPRATGRDGAGRWLAVAQERAFVVWDLSGVPRVAWVWDATPLTGDPERQAYAGAIRVVDDTLLASIQDQLHFWSRIDDAASLSITPLETVQWFSADGARARRSDWEAHRVIDVVSGAVLLEVDAPSEGDCTARLTDDGQHLLVVVGGHDSCTLTWWSVEEDKVTATLDVDAPLDTFALHDNQVFLVFSGTDEEDPQERLARWEPLAELVERWLEPQRIDQTQPLAVGDDVAVFDAVVVARESVPLTGLGSVQLPAVITEDHVLAVSFTGWNTRLDRHTGEQTRFFRAVDGTVVVEAGP